MEETLEEETIPPKKPGAGPLSDIHISSLDNWAFFFPITKPNDDIVQLFLCKPVYQLILLKGEMLKNHMQVLGLYPYEEKVSAKEKWGRGYFFNLIFAHNKHISQLLLI